MARCYSVPLCTCPLTNSRITGQWNCPYLRNSAELGMFVPESSQFDFFRLHAPKWSFKNFHTCCCIALLQSGNWFTSHQLCLRTDPPGELISNDIFTWRSSSSRIHSVEVTVFWNQTFSTWVFSFLFFKASLSCSYFKTNMVLGQRTSPFRCS